MESQSKSKHRMLEGLEGEERRDPAKHALHFVRQFKPSAEDELYEAAWQWQRKGYLTMTQPYRQDGWLLYIYERVGDAAAGAGEVA
jgi:hypothetical protein